MVLELLDSYMFFLPQLFFGTILGILLSFFGSFLVLRNMAFFGVTLSQVVTSGVALSLFFGIKGEWFAVIVSVLILVPLVAFQRRERKHFDTFLGILFVFFASFSQFLLSLGGNVKNQIMAAYFGDILTNQTHTLAEHLVVLLFGFCIFIFLFNKFLFLAWDRDEFTVRGNSIWVYEIIFYGVSVILLSIGVHMLGSFYSTAHLLVPAYSALAFVRSTRSLMVFSGIISAFATIIGFSMSLIGFEYNGEIVYFPTSSTIVVILVIIGFGLRWIKSK